MNQRLTGTQIEPSTPSYFTEITMPKRLKLYVPYLVLFSVAVVVYGIVAASFLAFPVATR